MKKTIIKMLTMAFLISTLTACAGGNVGVSDENRKAAGEADRTIENETENKTENTTEDTVSEKASDYSIPDNWLHLPDEVTKQVDTIYLYPTAFMDASEGAPEICGIDSESMRTMAKGFYEGQATVYEKATNVYAPYYRQINLAAINRMSTEERNVHTSGTPQTDVFAALDYYFKNYNGGRPFILAGHSQGSQMLTNVLGEYMKEHEEYLKRMVAAYVIGYSVTDEFLSEHPYLTFAEGRRTPA